MASTQAALLLAEAHGQILRCMSCHSSRHFQGLQQATRFYKGILSPQICRRLLQLETAHNVCRHVTQPFLLDLEIAVQSVLLAHTQACIVDGDPGGQDPPIVVHPAALKDLHVNPAEQKP